MQNYGKHVSTKRTPQSARPLDRPDMTKNRAGGYAFEVDGFQQLRRFLVIGSIGGTYYASEQELTRENAENIVTLIQRAGLKVVEEVVAISDAGRAPSNDPALFVLAMAAKLGDDATRAAARDALKKVARTGTHLFHFAKYLESFGGWGRGTKAALRRWYADRSPSSLALQLTKYQQRDGWSHRDVLRLAHFSNDRRGLSLQRDLALRWAAGKATDEDKSTIREHESLKLITLLEEFKTMDEAAIVQVLKTTQVPMELIPTEKRGKAVYEAIYPTAGLEWLLRNLGNLSRHKILNEGSALNGSAQTVINRFTNAEDIQKSRLHPLKILVGMRQYALGHGLKSRGEGWSVCQDVVDALDEAFHLAFQNVAPTGKRRVLAVDVSGSMDGAYGGFQRYSGFQNIAGTNVSPREAAAALVMVAYRTEKTSVPLAFSSGLQPINISRTDRLDRVINTMRKLMSAGTDCSLPMTWAIDGRHEVDSFEIYTDNETWQGRIHPFQALKTYREKFVQDAKLTVVGMTATKTTIGDCKDPGVLDVVGLDTATPNIIQDFIAGVL